MPDARFTSPASYIERPVPDTTADEPKGVTCKCGEFTPFSMWVYAHWQERLTFTCPGCGAGYSPYAGVAKPVKHLKRGKS